MFIIDFNSPIYYKNLMNIMDYNEEEIKSLDLVFNITEINIYTNKNYIIDLKPNGSNIIVNNNNKYEYIQLITEYKLYKSIKIQLNSFKKGFNEIIHLNLLHIFTTDEEFELLLAGLPNININDWKYHTIYFNGYNSYSKEIIWFWKCIESFNEDYKMKFLQFVTGELVC